MSGAIPIEDWPSRLEQAITAHCGIFQRITVLRETDSTQDAARRVAAKPGDVITTWRQTSGRGRLGRTWTDTLEHGVAVTFVTDRRQPEFLAIAAAIGAARAIETVARTSTQIKWPNDVLITGRKVAGVLIEQTDQVALIGVGINVTQIQWPAELNKRAVSLAQIGANVDRLNVLLELIPAMDAALRADAEVLNREFACRDALVGRTARFRCGQSEVEGRVLRVDPMCGIEVEMEDGRMTHLPAASTTILRVNDADLRPRSAVDFAKSPGHVVSSHPVDR